MKYVLRISNLLKLLSSSLSSSTHSSSNPPPSPSISAFSPFLLCRLLLFLHLLCNFLLLILCLLIFLRLLLVLIVADHKPSVKVDTASQSELAVI